MEIGNNLEPGMVAADDPRGMRGAALPVLCVLLLVVVVALLSGCGPLGGGAGLSGVAASSDSIVPGSSGVGNPPGAVQVRYTLGSAADVTARLQGQVSGTLMTAPQERGEHLVRFSGVVTADQALGENYRLVRRAVPDGDYAVVISAGDAQKSVPVKVNGSRAQPPTLSNMMLRPEVISPNQDAVDDVAELTFRTEETSTISVRLADAGGRETLVFAPEEKGAGEQNVVVNGQDLLGQTLPDGAYTVTLRLQDRAGNRVEAQRLLRIQGGGKPDVQILKVEFAPQQVLLGSSITVSVTVKNMGNVPLRTQGPDRGYTYTTNDSYSSVEGGKWVDRAGLWRVGVDWDGNRGGAAYRYPFRWGFGKTLMPGETVVTGGKITILKQERRMWFFAGILQEGVQIARDRLGITPIDVGF
ncbi:MAG: hypothetical protein ACJ78Q_12745 [Chloroflexia bacterium]